MKATHEGTGMNGTERNDKEEKEVGIAYIGEGVKDTWEGCHVGWPVGCPVDEL